MKGCLKVFAYICLGIIALGIITTVVSPSKPSPVQTGNLRQVALVATNAPSDSLVSDTPTTTPVPPTVTPEWMAPPFDEICGSNSNLTEIQQNAKVKTMLGKKLVGWTGKVYDAKQDGDKYTISVDMTPGLFRTRDVVITGITDASVASLNVDQQISFDATIQDIDIAFGVVCNPMTVTDAKITPR